MNEKINTDEMLSVEKVKRQMVRYTAQMKESLDAGGDRAYMAVKGTPVAVTEFSDEDKKNLRRIANRWGVLINDESEKSYKRMLALYMDLEELLEDVSAPGASENLEQICSDHPVTLLWPESSSELLEWTSSLDEEKRSAVHKLLIDEMNTRTIDCLMAAKNRDEINMDDFTA